MKTKTLIPVGGLFSDLKSAGVWKMEKGKGVK